MIVRVYRYSTGTSCKMLTTTAERRPRSGKLLLHDARRLRVFRADLVKPMTVKELAEYGIFLTPAAAAKNAVERCDAITAHYHRQIVDVEGDRRQALEAVAHFQRKKPALRIG